MVECRARAQPLELVARHRVPRLDFKGLAGALRHADRNVRPFLAVEEVLEADGLDDVAGADPRVVRLVNEPEGEDALLLEVRFVDAGERSGNNHSATWVRSTRLEASPNIDRIIFLP